MMIPFHKMHANGNDFIVIDSFYHNIPLPSRAILHKWADRHRGIGFDQLLYITHSEGPEELDAVCRIFNASGSEASQCGHGMACLAQFLYKQGYNRGNFFRIGVPSGVCLVQRIGDQRASVYLGCPVFEPRKIPFLRDQSRILYPIKILDVADQPLKQSMREIQRQQKRLLNQLHHPDISYLFESLSEEGVLLVGVVSVGNPHCVVLVEEMNHMPTGLAKKLSEHPDFPNGSNVEFMQIVSSDAINLRTYERGVGENQACGSGAAAAVVIARALGFLNPIVNVQFGLNDWVIVKWTNEHSVVKLETSTHFVFQGELSCAM